MVCAAGPNTRAMPSFRAFHRTPEPIGPISANDSAGLNMAEGRVICITSVGFCGISESGQQGLSVELCNALADGLYFPAQDLDHHKSDFRMCRQQFRHAFG